MQSNRSKEELYEHAQIDYENSNITGAIEHYKDCIDASYKEVQIDQNFIFERSIELSQVFLETNRPKEAIPFVQRANKIFLDATSELIFSEESADFLELLGNINYYFRNFAEAVECYSYAESLFSDLNSKFLSRAKKSLALSQQGNILKAVYDLNAIVEIKDLHPEIIIKVRKYLADIMAMTGQYRQALLVYEEILQEQTKRQGNEAYWLLEIQFNMASAHFELGNYGEALTQYRQVISEISLNNHPGGLRLRVQAIMMITKISLILRDIVEAERLLDSIDEKSLLESEQLYYRFIRAQLELFSLNSGEKEKTPFLDVILNYKVEKIRSDNEIEILVLQSNYHFHEGDFSASLEMIHRLIDHYQKVGDINQLIKFKLQLCDIQIHSGMAYNKSGIISILSNTEQLLKDYLNKGSVFIQLLQIAQIYCKLEEYEKAGRVLLRIFSYEWEMIRSFVLAGERELLFYQDVIENVLALTYLVSIKVSENKLLFRERFIELEIKRKSLSILNNRIFKEVISRPDLKGKDTILTYHQKFKELNSQNISNSDEYRKLKMEVDYLEGKIKKETDYFIRVQELINISWQDIQHELNPDEAALIFSRINEGDGSLTDCSVYLGILIHSHTVQPEFFHLEITEEYLRKALPFNLVRNFDSEGLFEYDVEIPLLDNLSNLYKSLVKPMEKSLKGVKKIWYSVDGLLNYIPFVALIDDENKYFGDKYKLAQLQTLRDIKKQEEALLVNSIAIFGGIDFSDWHESRDGENNSTRSTLSNLEQIEEAYIETRALSSLFTGFGITKYTPDYLNLNIFNKVCSENMPSCLHILTHGFFFNDEKRKYSFEDIFQYKSSDIYMHSNPLLRSGIFTSDYNNISKKAEVKPLETGVITSWDISRSQLRNTSLVTIHACESALGAVRNGETYGLVRAFKLAGTKYVILTLWQIQYTEFFIHFYRHLLQNDGKNVREAFNSAISDVRQKYPNPYWWSGFILIE